MAESFAKARLSLRRRLLRGDEIAKLAFVVPPEEYDGFDKLIDPAASTDWSAK